jgi:hypothetical protein
MPIIYEYDGVDYHIPFLPREGDMRENTGNMPSSVVARG